MKKVGLTLQPTSLVHGREKDLRSKTSRTSWSVSGTVRPLHETAAATLLSFSYTSVLSRRKQTGC